MVYSSEISDNLQENNPNRLIEDLNFYEIEIRMCELQLERLVMNRRNHQEIMKRVECFQNQFIIQQNNIKNIKDKLRRLCFLTNSFRLSNDWKKRKFYSDLKAEVKSFEENLNEILFDFNSYSKYWMH